MSVVLDASLELGDVPTDQLEAEACGWAGNLAAATCRFLLVIAELDRRESWGQAWGVRSMAHWLSWRCGLSLTTAREHARIGRALAGLPLVRAEFAAGRLSYSKVRALTRLVSVPHMEPNLVMIAKASTGAQLDTLAAGYVRAHRLNDPDLAAKNEAERNIIRRTGDDGASRMIVTGPNDQIGFVMSVLDAAADRLVPKEDGVGIATRRFDALIAIIERYAQPDETQPVPTTTVIHAEPTVTDPETIDVDKPGRIHGLPIGAAALARLCCDTKHAHEYTIEDGSIIRTPVTDEIPRPVRRAVMARDLSQCRWPGCGTKAYVNVHHLRYRSRGGTHDVANLACLCSFHHRWIHHRGWTIEGTPAGVLTFIHPDGTHINERPPPTTGNADTILDETIGPDTIAVTNGGTLDLHWAIVAICHNEQLRETHRSGPPGAQPSTHTGGGPRSKSTERDHKNEQLRETHRSGPPGAQPSTHTSGGPRSKSTERDHKNEQLRETHRSGPPGAQPSTHTSGGPRSKSTERDHKNEQLRETHRSGPPGAQPSTHTSGGPRSKSTERDHKNEQLRETHRSGPPGAQPSTHTSGGPRSKSTERDHKNEQLRETHRSGPPGAQPSTHTSGGPRSKSTERDHKNEQLPPDTPGLTYTPKPPQQPTWN